MQHLSLLYTPFVWQYFTNIACNIADNNLVHHVSQYLHLLCLAILFLKGLETVFGSVKKQGKQLSEVESVVKSYDDRVRLLEYKTIDLEARSRRNNILFFGISESRSENCKNVVADFLLAHLNTRITEADINRAHRVGRFDSRKKETHYSCFSVIHASRRNHERWAPFKGH